MSKNQDIIMDNEEEFVAEDEELSTKELKKKELKELKELKMEKITIQDLPGVGAATAERLEGAGFKDVMSVAVATIGELVGFWCF